MRLLSFIFVLSFTACSLVGAPGSDKDISLILANGSWFATTSCQSKRCIFGGGTSYNFGTKGKLDLNYTTPHSTPGGSGQGAWVVSNGVLLISVAGGGPYAASKESYKILSITDHTFLAQRIETKEKYDFQREQ